MASRSELATVAAIGEPAWLRWALIALALALLAGIVVLPLAVVIVEAARAGLGAYLHAISTPDTLAAVKLTLLVALAFARGVGEYGSVIFIAGNLPYVSEIAPLLIVIKLEEFDYRGATVIAVLMLALSFALLFLINKLQRRLARGQSI